VGQPRNQDLPHYIYDEYVQWEGRWELIDGIPYAMTPAPGLLHQRISQRIASVLDAALEECEQCLALLPVDWKIEEDTVVQPDNLVVCGEAKGAYLSKAPVLIFEVLSQSTAYKDKNTKFKLYEKNGVRHYVIVDPETRIATVYALQENRYAKVMDATDELLDFDLGKCLINFDFSKIWA